LFGFCVFFPIFSRFFFHLFSGDQEAAEQAAKVEKMKVDGKDPYDIRKQEEVLGESTDMIPHTRSRLQGFLDDLKAVMVRPFAYDPSPPFVCFAC
jgi:tubulin-specific chaperone A